MRFTEFCSSLGSLWPCQNQILCLDYFREIKSRVISITYYLICVNFIESYVKQIYKLIHNLINLINLMKARGISLSEFQKRQLNHATFKRNKMYLDLNKIHTDEKDMQLRRRQPQLIVKSPKSQSVNKKIQNSFRNSVSQLQSKLQQDTKRFKERVLNSPMNDNEITNTSQTRYETSRDSYANPQNDEQSSELSHNLNKMNRTASHMSYTARESQSSQNKIKGIPIERQISRDYLQRYHVERHLAADERSFNNFYITKGDLSKTQDFKKLSPRKINFVHEHLNDLTYNPQKSYEKLYYSQKPMKTTFRLSLQNSKEGRKIYVPPRPENVATTDLDPQKIYKSFTQTSCFRPNKIDQFYKMTGRNLPHQLDQRSLSPNKDFYKDSEGKIIKENVDYVVKKMYDDMVRKQKEELYNKKNPEFTRDQICDLRYFKEMIKREHKMAGLAK